MLLLSSVRPVCHFDVWGQFVFCVRASSVLLVVTAGVMLAACGHHGAALDAGGPREDFGAFDAGMLTDFGLPTGAKPCLHDVDCADGITCKHNFCDHGFCNFTVNLAVCDDGVFCNGTEQCDALRGCIPGPPQTCNDDNACTVDSCDEPTKSCNHAGRDLDGDGDIDWHCSMGKDCNDRDPTISSLAPEICADGVDNNCNGMIDEMPCGRVPYDTCASPLTISASGITTLSTVGAIPDYAFQCTGNYYDLVLALTITETSDLDIVATSDSTSTAIEMQSSCGTGTPLECNVGYPGEIRRRSVAPGTYYVIVGTAQPAAFDVNVQILPPTVAPPNVRCAAATDISAGGHFSGSFVDIADNVTTSCSLANSPDLVYSFTLTEPSNVLMDARATSGETLYLDLRTTCSDATSETRCTGGTPAEMRLYSLAAGTYFVWLSGSPYRALDFTFDVTFSAATPAPAGDTCANAVPLTFGTTVMASLSADSDDFTISCNSFGADAVYSFTLTEPRDVEIMVNSENYSYASVRTDCTAGMSQLECASGAPNNSVLHDLAAGTYYVIVETNGSAGYTIEAQIMAPIVPVAVSGNDGCAMAYAIAPSGGLFTGDTTADRNDFMSSCGGGGAAPDAVFLLALSGAKHIVASLAGSTYDTILTVQQGTCGATTEVACDDDSAGNLNAKIDQTFPAGNYFLVVDGFGAGSVGAYTLSVTVSDP